MQGVDRSLLVDVVSEALGLPRARVEKLLESRSTRVMRYRRFTYVTLRRDVGGHYEGTVVFLLPDDGYRVVEG